MRCRRVGQKPVSACGCFVVLLLLLLVVVEVGVVVDSKRANASAVR
jgi:hypothetical protein